MAHTLKTWMKYCSKGRVHLSQLPVVWLSHSLSDCLPALMQAQVLPPFLREMPFVLACTHWSEPPPDTHCQGATSVLPGRCLFHTHLSPGSQRPAHKWKQEVGKQCMNLNGNQRLHGSWNVPKIVFALTNLFWCSYTRNTWKSVRSDNRLKSLHVCLHK